MKKDDTCYYMSITKEENSAFVVNQNQQTQEHTEAHPESTVKEGEPILLPRIFTPSHPFCHFRFSFMLSKYINIKRGKDSE
jgi:hypothetical protein